MTVGAADATVSSATGPVVFRTPEAERVATVRPPPVSLSVVIPMFNAAEVICEQLAALADSRPDVPWEVVVADNGSTDDSAAVVSGWSKRLPVRVVNASDRRGASHARNTGTRASTGELVLYCDADDVVAPGWINSMVAASCHADLVAGALDEDTLNRSPILKLYPEPPRDLSSFGFLPWGVSANLAVRREVFDVIGGWDVNYPHGGDDVDFCWRTQLAGYTFGYAPQASVAYRHRPGYRTLIRQQWHYTDASVRLYGEYRDRGLRREPREALQGWLWLLSRSPYVLSTARRRRLWVALAVKRFGRLWASQRLRVWFP